MMKIYAGAPLRFQVKMLQAIWPVHFSLQHDLCCMKHMISGLLYESYGTIWTTTQYELRLNTEYDLIRGMLRVKFVRPYTRYDIPVNHVRFSTRYDKYEVRVLWKNTDTTNTTYDPTVDLFKYDQIRDTTFWKNTMSYKYEIVLIRGRIADPWFAS